MGERQGDRAAMDQVTRDLVASGVRPDKAQQIARDSMVRTDRSLRDQKKR